LFAGVKLLLTESFLFIAGFARAVYAGMLLPELSAKETSHADL
jgi:hypothetical protein